MPESNLKTIRESKERRTAPQAPHGPARKITSNNCEQTEEMSHIQILAKSQRKLPNIHHKQGCIHWGNKQKSQRKGKQQQKDKVKSWPKPQREELGEYEFGQADEKAESNGTWHPLEIHHQGMQNSSRTYPTQISRHDCAWQKRSERRVNITLRNNTTISVRENRHTKLRPHKTEANQIAYKRQQPQGQMHVISRVGIVKPKAT